MENISSNTSKISLGDTKLLKFFTDNLDKIYCAKKHMIERFPEIADEAFFIDINHAIMETVEDVKKQVARMNGIYEMLGTSNSIAGCAGLTAMIEEAFDAIAEQKEDTAMRDMCILFYLQNLESIEVASFQVLKMMATKLNNQEILQLINENLDEAKEDRRLLLMITSKYVNN